MITDDKIRKAVIQLFKKYDKDKSGYIQAQEISYMWNDLTKQLANKKQYSQQQINHVLSTVDRNQDGKVSKDQLFILMKKLNS